MGKACQPMVLFLQERSQWWNKAPFSFCYPSVHNWTGHLGGRWTVEGAEAEYLNMILNVRKDSYNAFLFGAFIPSEN